MTKKRVKAFYDDFVSLRDEEADALTANGRRMAAYLKIVQEKKSRRVAFYPSPWYTDRMLPIGIISTAYFDYDGYKEGIAQAKADGFDCLDYQNFAGDARLYGMREEERKAYLSDLARCAADCGVRFNQMHALWPPEIDTPAHREESDEKLRTSVRGAFALRCPHLVVHPYMPRGWGQDEDPAQTFALNVDMLSSLCAYAADYNIVICVENLPFGGVPIAATRETVRLVKAVGAKNIGVCLDTGHVNVLREDIGEAVRCAGALLSVLHVHDNNGHSDAHCIPWQGTVDWNAFTRALSDVKFDGCISLESEFINNMPALIRADLRCVASHAGALLARKVKA